MVKAPAPIASRDVAPAQPEAAAPPRVEPAASAANYCLIVDDSRVIRRVSRGIVESLGFTVNEAENGEEALLRCSKGMPDLILLDWNMPVMTGIQFVTALRAQPGGKKPKVVFCTTENADSFIGKAIAAGADGYVVKPFDEATLRDKLQRIGAA